MQIIIASFPFIWSIIAAILHFFGIYQATMTILVIAAIGILLILTILVIAIVSKIKKIFKNTARTTLNSNEEESKVSHDETMTLDEIFNNHAMDQTE